MDVSVYFRHKSGLVPYLSMLSEPFHTINKSARFRQKKSNVLMKGQKYYATFNGVVGYKAYRPNRYRHFLKSKWMRKW